MLPNLLEDIRQRRTSRRGEADVLTHRDAAAKNLGQITSQNTTANHAEPQSNVGSIAAELAGESLEISQNSSSSPASPIPAARQFSDAASLRGTFEQQNVAAAQLAQLSQQSSATPVSAATTVSQSAPSPGSSTVLPNNLSDLSQRFEQTISRFDKTLSAAKTIVLLKD